MNPQPDNSVFKGVRKAASFLAVISQADPATGEHVDRQLDQLEVNLTITNIEANIQKQPDNEFHQTELHVFQTALEALRKAKLGL